MNKSTVEKILKRAALAADEERANKSRIDARNELELALEEAKYELNKVGRIFSKNYFKLVLKDKRKYISSCPSLPTHINNVK
jgi:ParB-like chromosome segregation protein Spo0J